MAKEVGRINKITGLFLIIATMVLGQTDFYFTEPVTKDRLSRFPNPADNRNYFFLQSIDDNTSIIIGDFTGNTKKIVQIVDTNSDNTVDHIFEYYPEIGKFKRVKKCTSQFFKDNIAELKKDIISGKIYRENYSYQMQCLDVLKYKIEEGFDIYPSDHGYNVKFFDQDEPSSPMSEFYFNKSGGRYDLQFKTNYLKILGTKIKPPIAFSVYCVRSKDPIVAEIVESLIKDIQP